MSCVLRVRGEHFDVDVCLAECKLVPINVWHKGKRRSRNAKEYGTSGACFEVSGADFSDLSAQIEDALAFFHANRDGVRRLTSFPGVESSVADFGVKIRVPFWASFRFDPRLLEALSAANVSLEISVYPSDDDEAEDA